MAGLFDNYQPNIALLKAAQSLFEASKSGQGTMQGIASGLLGYQGSKQAQAQALIDKKKAEDEELFNRSYKEDQQRYIRAQTSNLNRPGKVVNRPTATGVGGFLNYLDGDKERVFPDQVKPVKVTNNFDSEQKLRKEYNALSIPFTKQSQAYSRIVSSAKDPSAAGDMALIFNYMKVLDPGSTVREGEFATAQNAGGLDSKITSLYNSIINGQRLDHKQRNDFVDRAGRLFSGSKELQTSVDDRYKNLAIINNLNPENILYNPNQEIYQYPQDLLNPIKDDRVDVQEKKITVTTQAQFDALPEGTFYYEDGIEYQKLLKGN